MGECTYVLWWGHLSPVRAFQYQDWTPPHGTSVLGAPESYNEGTSVLGGHPGPWLNHRHGTSVLGLEYPRMPQFWNVLLQLHREKLHYEYTYNIHLDLKEKKNRAKSLPSPFPTTSSTLTREQNCDIVLHEVVKSCEKKKMPNVPIVSSLGSPYTCDNITALILKYLALRRRREMTIFYLYLTDCIRYDNTSLTVFLSQRTRQGLSLYCTGSWS